VLWPPNHLLVPVRVTWIASDLCDPAPAVAFVSMISSEPDSGTGNGRLVSIGPLGAVVLLRAERAGDGPGRVYELTFRATDASGNPAMAGASVSVPHDRAPIVFQAPAPAPAPTGE